MIKKHLYPNNISFSDTKSFAYPLQSFREYPPSQVGLGIFLRLIGLGKDYKQVEGEYAIDITHNKTEYVYHVYALGRHASVTDELIASAKKGMGNAFNEKCYKTKFCEVAELSEFLNSELNKSKKDYFSAINKVAEVYFGNKKTDENEAKLFKYNVLKNTNIRNSAIKKDFEKIYIDFSTPEINHKLKR